MGACSCVAEVVLTYGIVCIIPVLNTLVVSFVGTAKARGHERVVALLGPCVVASALMESIEW